MPVNGPGETDRDANGLTFGEGRSLLPSTSGDDAELEETVEEDSLSLTQSALAAGWDKYDFIALG